MVMVFDSLVDIVGDAGVATLWDTIIPKEAASIVPNHL
jgi:hypothetical protein